MLLNDMKKDGKYVDLLENKIEKIEQDIDNVAQVFIIFFNEKYRYWPYQIPVKDKTLPDYSISTNSMIIFTLMTLFKMINNSYLLPREYIKIGSINKNKNIDKTAQDIIYEAAEKLEEMILNNGKISSNTFGNSDPLTLSWVSEIFYNEKIITKINEKSALDWKKLNKIISDGINNLIARLKKDKVLLSYKKKGKKVLPRPQDHAFLFLRTAQIIKNERFKDIKHLAKDKKIGSNGLNEKLAQYFKSRIDKHLSSYLVSDIDFDVAELVFSLEGMLLTKPNLIRSETIEKIFNILKERQVIYPFWRPMKPLTTRETGLVLMPVSVEVANSLIRICSLLAEINENEEYLFQNIDLFVKYEEWLKTLFNKGEDKIKRPYFGWRSEHTSEPETIHLWETSQVLIFLVYYLSLIKKYVSRDYAKNLNLSLKPRFKLGISDSGKEPPEPIKSLKPFIKPKSTLEGMVNIKEMIEKFYINPRKEGMPNGSDDIHYSMILYGPPGTGKTSLAKWIAKELKYDLIEITPSDFIAEGEAGVEARAKAIFNALYKQEEAVILFDEIDRLILDRNSKAYSEQGDIFQFMTPSMLSKFKDLREIKKSIFIIATNYYERIDEAIKRKGRVDDNFLLLPPDCGARNEILKKLSEKENLLTNSEIEEIAKMTQLFVYDELKQLVSIIKQRKKAGRGKKIDIKNCVNQIKPITSLNSYIDRFKKNSSSEFKWSQEPLDEFCMLITIYLENNKDDEITRIINKETLKKIKAWFKDNLPEYNVVFKKLFKNYHLKKPNK